MKDYKDLLLQGLSARLNSYENTNEPRSIINSTPRKYLREQKASNKNQNYSNNINNDINQNYFKSQRLKSVGNFGDPNQFIKRIIAAGIFFMVITLVQFAVNIVTKDTKDGGIGKCINCLISGNECQGASDSPFKPTD